MTIHTFKTKEELNSYKDLLLVEYNIQLAELQTKLFEVTTNLDNLKSLK